MAIRKSSTAHADKINPFIEGTNIPDIYFCGREAETESIIRLLANGNNVVLKSRRRLGKSSLVNHILNRPEIKQSYNTIYMDLYGTGSAEDFARTFQQAFSGQAFTRLETAREILKSLPGKASLEAEYNELTRTGKLKMGFVDLKKIDLSLETIFGYLEQTQKPNIVIFDEFQQITYYPEPMAAILRSYIQRLNNTKFIFSGSSRRMLTTMFNSSNEPFYNSAESIDLGRIPEQTYSEFCIRNFNRSAKNISEDAIEFAYELCGGSTKEMQRIMRAVFAGLDKGDCADVDDVKTAVTAILDREDQTYREKINSLIRSKEKNVFVAIALEGVASGMLSLAINKKYNLGPTSSVAQSLNKLCDEDKLNLTLKIGDSYIVQDKMFELWTANQYGLLDSKFATAKEQFQKELNEENKVLLPKF